MKIQNTILAVAALTLSSAAMAVPTYTATYLGNDCVSTMGATCADLGSTTSGVSGGAVIAPATSVSGVAKRPGDDTSNGAQVLSYNVTSRNNNPVGAATDIVITGLDGAFDFYWGSIDSYNIVDFYLGADKVSYNGNQAFAATGAAGTAANFNTDGYFSFSGAFDKVVLSSANGVAFEVARAMSVPEPGTFALLGLGLAGLGAARRRQKA